ncbi:MAG TPA: Calx-beta domain-containing protein, partial [Pyrinomonadaceae bacterium]|nr:Calx-beta domain-containing protein [Pyrinomonadaceae bacterium]
AVSMTSATFDTYLYLLNSSDQTIAQDDDGGDGTNSRIPAVSGFFTLPATGTYKIYATSFSFDGTTGSTGSYTLSIAGVTSCSYALSSNGQSFGASGGSGTFGISTSANCGWSAVSNAGWLTTNSSGSSSGTISYVVASNGGAARTATITVGGQVFTVTQSAGGGSCPSTTLSLGQTLNGTLTTSDCIFSGTTRYVDVYDFNGNAGQQISVTMNSSTFDTYLYLLDSGNQLLAEDDDGGGLLNSRIPGTVGLFTLPATGMFRIYATSYSASGLNGSTGSYTINLTSASSCSYSLNPTSQSFGASSGNGSITVTTSTGCNWTATSNASWLTTSSSGSGTGTANYSVASNSGAGRVGTLTIAGLTFTVNQAGVGGLQLSSAIYNISEGAGSVQVAVTRPDTAGAATVDYATSDTAALTECNLVNGVGSSRCDYATTIGTLRFAAGEASKSIFIPVVDDGYAEGNEGFSITLSNPTGVMLGSPTTALVTINDNETANVANPITGNDFFIRQQYIDFLGREPDPGGLAGWRNVLVNCGITVAPPCDRIEVSAGFFRSEEFQSRGYFIYRFFSALGRIPVSEEFYPDFAKVSGFLTTDQLEANKAAYVNEVMARADFQTKYGSTLSNPTAYVEALLQTVGLPSHPSKQSWINTLNASNTTTTRGQVLRQLVESAQVFNKYYNEAFVIMQYFGYLRRTADASYLSWINTMNQTSGDYRIMINGFMNSAEYRRRFGP